MGFRNTSVAPVITGRGDGTRVIVGDQGSEIAQDPETSKMTNARVNRQEGDVPITDHDLIADGDFIIPDSVSSLDNPPFIGGASRSILGVESTDDNNFSIKFEYGTLESDGTFTTLFTYDKNDDARLDGDSKYVIQIRPIRDRVKVTISDSAGGAQNNISGGLNSN